MNKMAKLICIIVFISFLSLYFGLMNGTLSVNRNNYILTDKEIALYEKNVRDGKPISNGYRSVPIYNNSFSSIGLKLSKYTEKAFKGIMKIIFKGLEGLDN